jgi:hypothetical protein
VDEQRFNFRFDPRLRPVLWLWGVRERDARVVVGPRGLYARFGPMRVRTDLGNISGAELTGPYRWWTAIGIRESLADHGLSLGSNVTAGVCIRFHTPVSGIPPGARHPGLTVTVEDTAGLLNTINRLIGSGAQEA